MGCDGGTRSAPIFTRAEKGLKMEHLLEVKNLSVTIDGLSGEVQAVRDVSFSLKKGEVLAIVGESGCGKSVLCKSIMKLLPPSAKIKEGSICVNGQDITCYREKEMQKLRGKVFSMIFQDPMTSLNPTIKIGKQIAEAVIIHNKNYTKDQVDQKVLELMELVVFRILRNAIISIPGSSPAGCARDALWRSHLHQIRIFYLQMSRRLHWM